MQANLSIWKGAVNQITEETVSTDSRTLIPDRLWHRCRKSLERIYQLYPQETFRLIIYEWYSDSKVMLSQLLKFISELLIVSARL